MRRADASHPGALALAVVGAGLAALALVPPDTAARWLDPRAAEPRLGALLEGLRLFRLLAALHAALAGGAAIWLARRSPSDEPRPSLWAPGPRTDGPWRPLEIALVAALLVAAAVVRLVGARSDLWMDEVFTLTEFVRKPAGVIATSFPHDNQHLLYSLLARASVATLGESVLALRLPAILLGLASLVAVLRLGALSFGRRVALLALALLALSYHHVWFSQNARGYTGLLLGTVLATDLLLRALWRGGIGRWLAYAASVALAMWIHLTMVFVPLAHGLVVLGLVAARTPSAGPRATIRSALPAFAALASAGSLTLLLYAPVLPQVLAFFARPGGGSTTAAVEWKSPLWLLNETFRGLGVGLALGWLGLAAGCAVFATGGLRLLRRDPTVAGLFALPPTLGGVALLALGRNLWPRFFFQEAGFAALVAVDGACALGALAARAVRARGPWPARLELAPALLLIVASAITLPRGWRLPKQDYTGARDFVRAEARPGDRVVGLDVAGEVYHRYYAPEWAWARSREELETDLAPAGATWVLYTLPRYLGATQPDLVAWLERDFELVRSFPGTVGDGAIVVRRRPAPAGDTP